MSFAAHDETSRLTMAQALVKSLQAYYQPCNEQSMVHTAIGIAKSNQPRWLRIAKGYDRL
jgi:TPP-dependent trihydroxycyclohexane-1,2-dione (THcHDO) dehydratase